MNRGRKFLLATMLIAGFIILAGCGRSSESKTYHGEGNLIVTIFSPLKHGLYNASPNLSYEATEGDENTPIEVNRLNASLHGVGEDGNDDGTIVEVTNLYSGVVLPDVSDGLHRLEFIVDDKSGNLLLTINTFYSTDTTSAPIENVEINDQTPDETTDGTIVTTDSNPVLDYTIEEDCFETNTCEEMVFIGKVDPVTGEIVDREPITTRNGDPIETQDDGTYVIEIIYTDEAGNPSSTTITYTIDSTPPAVSISLPSGDVINVTSGSVSYTVDESGTATTFLDGKEIDSRDVTAGVVETVSFDGLPLGSHEVVIVTVDELGNSSANLDDNSAYTTTFTIVDLGTPIVTIQEPNELYNTTTVPLGFTYSDDMTSLDNLQVEVTLEVWDSTSGLGGEWIMANSHIVDVDIPGGTLTVDEDGAYLLTVQVTDQSDNTSSTSKEFSVDTTEPIVEISSPADGSTVGTNAPILEVYSTESSDNGVATFLFQGAYVDTFDRAASSVGIGSGHALKQSNGDPLSDGLWTVVVEITDDAGNMGWNYSTFTVDAIPPQVDVLNPVEGANYPNGNVNLKIKASGFTSVLIWISHNGAAYPDTPNLNISLNDEGWSNGVYDKKELQNLAEGEYSLKAVAVNEGGIVTESNPVEVNFTVFANKPGLTINAPSSDNQYFQVDELVPFELDASNYTSVVVKVDGLEVTGAGGGIPSDLGSYGTDKVGVHSVTVTASNGAGDETVSADFYIDGAIPVVKIDNPSGSYSADSSVQLSYTITDNYGVDDSSVRVTLTSPDGSVTEVSTRNGDYLSSLDSGSYSIEVTASDLAGNGSDPAVVNFTILDPPPPPPPDDDDDDDGDDDGDHHNHGHYGHHGDDDHHHSKKGKSSCHTGPIKGDKDKLLELVLCTSDDDSSHHRD